MRCNVIKKIFAVQNCLPKKGDDEGIPLGYHSNMFNFYRNDYKKAVKTYKKGLTINPQSIILLYEIGLAYSKLKNHKKALEYWKKLLKIAPHSIPVIDVKWRLNRLKRTI